MDIQSKLVAKARAKIMKARGGTKRGPHAKSYNSKAVHLLKKGRLRA